MKLVDTEEQNSPCNLSWKKYSGSWLSTSSFLFSCKDFGRENMDKLGHGIYKQMDINLLPPLFLIYAENPSDSGKVRFVYLSLEEIQFICSINHLFFL